MSEREMKRVLDTIDMEYDFAKITSVHTPVIRVTVKDDDTEDYNDDEL